MLENFFFWGGGASWGQENIYWGQMPHVPLIPGCRHCEFEPCQEQEPDYGPASYLYNCICLYFQVCRQAGYYEHALFLAEKHHQHNLYLKIQLEDIKDYQKALTYIAKLDFEEVKIQIKRNTYVHAAASLNWQYQSSAYALFLYKGTLNFSHCAFTPVSVI